MITIENQRAIDPILDGLIKRIGHVDGGNVVLRYVIARLVLETTDETACERLLNGTEVLLAVCNKLQRRLFVAYEKEKATSLHQTGGRTFRNFAVQADGAFDLNKLCCGRQHITEALTDEQIAAVEKERNEAQ